MLVMPCQLSMCESRAFIPSYHHRDVLRLRTTICSCLQAIGQAIAAYAKGMGSQGRPVPTSDASAERLSRRVRVSIAVLHSSRTLFCLLACVAVAAVVFSSPPICASRCLMFSDGFFQLLQPPLLCKMNTC